MYVNIFAARPPDVQKSRGPAKLAIFPFLYAPSVVSIIFMRRVAIGGDLIDRADGVLRGIERIILELEKMAF